MTETAKMTANATVTEVREEADLVAASARGVLGVYRAVLAITAIGDDDFEVNVRGIERGDFKVHVGDRLTLTLEAQ